MEHSETVEERIIGSVRKFESDQMQLNPVSIQVNLQSGTLFVMLEGIIFPAEKAWARDEGGRERLEQYHARTFDAGKQILEAEIQTILGRPVERSTLRVDPISGNGVIQFSLGQSIHDKDCTFEANIR